MRTCIIQTNNCPQSLIRFTEVKCFFDYKNEWLGFFDKVIITENADTVEDKGWKINAGQYITSNIRNRYQDLTEIDLRQSKETIDFDPMHWSGDREMKYYRGQKQEYIFRYHMAMILKSEDKNIYFSNNESLCNITGHQGEIFVPASGVMAGRIKFYNPDTKIIIYDINPTQIQFSKWLNSQTRYPSALQVEEYMKTLGNISISESYDPNVKDWVPVDAEYKCIDILEQKLHCPTVISNILKFMPVYHKHGSSFIQQWQADNLEYLI